MRKTRRPHETGGSVDHWLGECRSKFVSVISVAVQFTRQRVVHPAAVQSIGLRILKSPTSSPGIAQRGYFADEMFETLKNIRHTD